MSTSKLKVKRKQKHGHNLLLSPPANQEKAIPTFSAVPLFEKMPFKNHTLRKAILHGHARKNSYRF